MKKLVLLISVLFLLSNSRAFAQCSASITLLGSATGCGNRTLTANPIGNTWTQKASMTSNRTAAAGFSIGNKGYIGTGATPSSNFNNDFWEYDQATNAWTQKANFPGVARQAAVGFSIGNKGYMGTGVDLNNIRKNDFYEYDPVSNTWITRANITGSRSFAVGFSIGTKGYVGTGYVSTSYATDFYEFNPVTNTWTAKANFGGVGRHSATGFSIGTKGYVGFGSTGSAGTGDFWEYDPATNLWNQKAGIYGMQMFAASGFALGGKGYMVCGKDQGTTNLYSSKTYQYDPAINLWRLMAANNANSKNYAVAFTIGGKGYVGTGSAGNSINAATNTLWEYEPWASYLWSNSATTQSISVVGTASYSVLITTAVGCTASASQSIATAPNPTLSLSGGSLVCSATNSSLTASGASTYTWSGNAGGGNGAQAVVTPTVSTTYTVSGTTGSCSVSYPVSVLVSGAPVANISVSGPTLGCGPRTLSVNPGGDVWTQKANMSVGHERAIGFSIGSKGYLGTGTDGAFSKDFWEYDPVTNAWTQKADFGGGDRFHTYNFAIGGKGYAGGGYSQLGLYGFAMDFWEYDPVTNVWTRKGDVPMTPRFVSVSFAIGNKGYMGTGQDNYGNFAFNDFWEYDPLTDLWTQKANVPTVGRAGAAAFSIGNKGYLGSGYPAYPSTTPFTDFWEYNPTTNSWAAIAGFPGGAGGNGVGFAIGNKGYVTNGSYTLNPVGLWEYNPLSNTWAARANFTGTPRPWSVAFVVGSKGYMGSGPIGSTLSSYNDLWEYEPGASFAWSTGATTPSIIASASGSYSLIINTVAGCTVSSAQSLSLSPNPSVTISSNPNFLCAGQSATLSAGGVSTYTWSANAGGGNASSVIVTPTASGSYTVLGTMGTCTASAIQDVTVNPLPLVTANSSSTLVCQGLQITLNGGGATTYTWTGGAINNTPFVPGATTDYTVTGSANNCTNTAVVSVTVNPSPTVTVNSGSICAGKTFTLSPGGALSYTYSGGSNLVTPGLTTSYSVTGINAIGCTNAIPAVSTVTVNALPLITANSGSMCVGSSYTIVPGGASSYTYSSGSNVVSPANTSTYGVTGTSTAGCVSSNQTSLTVTVMALPLVSAGNGTICNGQSFTLNPGGANTYTILPGGSSIVTPAANTTYTITGADLFGCVSAAPATASIQVLVSPTVSVNSGSICAGESFTLNPGGALSYTYSGGSDVVSPAATSVYTVTGLNANGCTNAVPATATVIVHNLPVVSANSGVLCTGSSYTISPSGAANYTYSGGSNIVSPAITTTYAIVGSSSVGCVSSAPAIITVTVSALPLVLVNSGSLCSGSSFTLSPSGALNYTYLPGNSAIVNPATSTSYSVIGANADGCLSATPAISSVTVYATPQLSVNSGSICLGSSFTLSPGGAVSYTYSGGSAVVSPNTSTTYSVTGMSAEGCITPTPALANVTVSALPLISANSGTICAGSSFTMSPSGASTYTYSSGSNIVSPIILTSYTINGSSAAGCLGNTVLVTVSVQPALTLGISGPTLVCSGNSILLTASGASTYTWNTGANSQSIAPSPVSGTVYVVNATSGVCTASSSQVVSVLSSPTLSVVYSNALICVGDTASLTGSGADQYSWSDGSALPAIVIGPTVTTSYTLTGINLNGCKSTSVLTQQVSDCTGMAESGSAELTIRVFPNPNQGQVTVSSPLFPKQASVEVYNYLGQLIYTELLNGTETQLHFENEAKGMYTLRVSVKGKAVFATKLLVQ